MSVCGTGGVVNYQFTATPHCGSNVTLNCDPPDGSFVSPGTYFVRCFAIDDCGQMAQCSFTVTVEPDRTPPILSCSADRVVECGTPWTFDPPTATDNCDGTNVTIRVTSTVTNALCGRTFRATRTWSASDTSSNIAFCLQTITVMDTTPPLITCASNRTVECGTAWSFDNPTASDACDGNNVILSVV